MDLKDFIKKVLIDLNRDLDEASSVTSRDISLYNVSERGMVEFDVAVSTENKQNKKGGGGIKVLNFIEGGGKLENKVSNSTVSRVQFRLFVKSKGSYVNKS